jgi:hypothetical protein
MTLYGCPAETEGMLMSTARSTKHEAQSTSEAASQVRMLVDGRPDDNLVSTSTSNGK